MAFGDYATLRDSFTRANETPLASPWTTFNGNSLNLSSNAAVSPDTTNAQMVWTTQQFGPDCQVYATVAAFAGGTAFVFARTREIGGSFRDGYVVTGNAATATLQNIVDGTHTVVDSVSVSLSNSDAIGIECSGRLIRGFLIRSGVATQILIATDMAGTGNEGYAGIGAAQAAGVTIDNFFAGTIPSVLVGQAVTYHGGEGSAF